MITPKAFGCIIKHFDEIDKVVSSRMTRKRPWSEPSLTSLLCDMLDEETQADGKINYTFEQLQNDLKSEDGLFGVNLYIETIEFNPAHERYISQSDIGLRLVFDNKIEPSLSWTRPYLLQAKRLFPKSITPLTYPESSGFTSFDKNQKARIDLMNKLLGDNYLKYLLFCPRPDGVDDDTKVKLAYLRNTTLSKQIFDFTSGLEIYKELVTGAETLKAGIFFTDTDNANPSFGQVHAGILNSTFPLGWFIAMNFSDNDRFLQQQRLVEKNSRTSSNFDSNKLVNGILTGDEKEVNELVKRIKEISNETFPDNIQLLPKHTITIRVSVGEQINPDNRRIKSQ